MQYDLAIPDFLLPLLRSQLNNLWEFDHAHSKILLTIFKKKSEEYVEVLLLSRSPGPDTNYYFSFISIL